MLPLRLGCYNACNVVFIKLVSIKALDAEKCKRLVGIRTNGTNTNIASVVHTISMDSVPSSEVQTTRRNCMCRTQSRGMDRGRGRGLHCFINPPTALQKQNVSMLLLILNLMVGHA